MTDRKITPQDRYNKEKTTTVNIRFMKNTEQELIDHLNAQPNKAGYIKSLIRADMAKNTEDIKEDNTENKYIAYNRSTYGTVTYNDDLYILLQHAYIDGVESNAYFRATAIRPSDIEDGTEEIPVYCVVWNIPDEWDPAGEAADLINWDAADDVSKTCADFCLSDGIIF